MFRLGLVDTLVTHSNKEGFWPNSLVQRPPWLYASSVKNIKAKFYFNQSSVLKKGVKKGFECHDQKSNFKRFLLNSRTSEMHFRAVAAAVCPLRCLKTFHFIFQQGEVLSENRKDTHDPRLSPRDISACITDLFDVFLFLPTSFVLT